MRLQDLPKESSLVTRNIIVLGRRTSVRLEPAMWSALRDIARRERCTIHAVCSMIKLRKSRNTSLTAAIRVFLMLYYRAAATEEGHEKAGHGNFEAMLHRARLTDDIFPAFSAGARSPRRASPRNTAAHPPYRPAKSA